jgi:transcriptional regulator with XRE-family HTH domain
MGWGRRTIPAQMPKKLEKIRLQLGCNLEEMISQLNKTLHILGYSNIKIFRSHILEFEKGRREPQLPVLLAYARMGNVSVDVLIDNELELL